MKSFRLILAALFAAITLSACSASTGDASRVSEDSAAEGVVTVEYDGKPLDCITWYGSHSEVGLSCDFVKYHMGKELDTALTPEEQTELERLLQKANGESK